MGATIIHGRELRKVTDPDFPEPEYGEIEALDGEHDSASYSTVGELVRHSESKGIDPSLWPIYYDTPAPNVDLVEVCERCKKLIGAMRELRFEEISENPLMMKIFEWLNSGETVYITE